MQKCMYAKCLLVVNCFLCEYVLLCSQAPKSMLNYAANALYIYFAILLQSESSIYCTHIAGLLLLVLSNCKQFNNFS